MSVIPTEFSSSIPGDILSGTCIFFSTCLRTTFWKKIDWIQANILFFVENMSKEYLVTISYVGEKELASSFFFIPPPMSLLKIWKKYHELRVERYHFFPATEKVDCFKNITAKISFGRYFFVFVRKGCFSGTFKIDLNGTIYLVSWHSFACAQCST